MMFWVESEIRTRNSTECGILSLTNWEHVSEVIAEGMTLTLTFSNGRQTVSEFKSVEALDDAVDQIRKLLDFEEEK